MTLYLLPYLNYYNRNIIKYKDVGDYLADFGDIDTLSGVNFIPNDGIRTTQIVNYTSGSDWSISAAKGEIAPGYVLVVNEYDEIVSRWWVIESQLVRNGQARLSLLRDVIADYYESIVETPSFIKKGYISYIYDNAIYNNEDMTFNQIKTSETPIKDASATGWYIGYMADTVGGESSKVSISKVSQKLIGSYTSMEQYPYNQYQETPFIGDYNSFTTVVNYTPYMEQGWDENGNPKLPTHNATAALSAPYGAVYSTTSQGYRISATGSGLHSVLASVSRQVKNIGVDWTNLSYAYTNVHHGTALDDFLAQDGKYVEINDLTYRIRINKRENNTQYLGLDNNSPYAAKVKQVINNANAEWTSPVIDTSSIVGTLCGIEYSYYSYTIELIKMTDADITYTIPVNRNHCIDAPYDIIAIPAGKITLYTAGPYFICSPSLARSIVDKLIIKLDKQGYDWQYLPYCPFDDDLFSPDGDSGYARLDTTALKENEYTIIGSATDASTIALYPSHANFTKIIAKYPITVSKDDPIEFKVENECDMYRLCSPNYNGQFEFSAAKNGGVISWQIACSYKPFNPYIRVAPTFSRLYGFSFDDARGLICGGDFSLPQTRSDWEAYELSNKNYQVMFDRQIENMEVNNAVQRKLERWNVATSALTTGITAGMAGGMMGGAGAGIGAGIGAGAISTIAGIADIQLNEKLRAEAMDFAKDQFGYQLQNIKAMPHSLTKVGAATEDYKIWPFVEYYTCGDIEKQALREKLVWNGMTIGRIGKIEDFINTGAEKSFIQATPIQIDGTKVSSAILDVIKAELQTGVYIVQ